MIPALRAAFDAALAQLGTALVDLRTRGYLATALARRRDERGGGRALHPPGDGGSPTRRTRSLAEYRAELTRVRDTLQRMEDQYLGTDQAAADRYRRT